MKAVWSPEAISDLAATYDYVARDDPKAAREIVGRIVSLVEDKLPAFPEIGRARRVPGTRELIVPGTPFIVPYRVSADRIEIARVFHAARRWPTTL